MFNFILAAQRKDHVPCPDIQHEIPLYLKLILSLFLDYLDKDFSNFHVDKIPWEGRLGISNKLPDNSVLIPRPCT